MIIPLGESSWKDVRADIKACKSNPLLKFMLQYKYVSNKMQLSIVTHTTAVSDSGSKMNNKISKIYWTTHLKIIWILHNQQYCQGTEFRIFKLKTLNHNLYNEHNRVNINSTETLAEQKIDKYLFTLNLRETLKNWQINEALVELCH